MKKSITRSGARATILAAANIGSYRQQTGSRYSARHINEAVCRCRRFGLVKAETLVTAGFNAKAKR